MSSKRRSESYKPDNPLAPLPEFEVKYNCKVRYFPDNQIKISCFSRAIYNPNQAEEHGKPEKQEENLLDYDPETDTMAYKYIEGKTIYDPTTNTYVPLKPFKEKRQDGEQRTDSLKRAIDKAFEIGLANDFHYFVTLTLDKTKIDRYNPSLIYPRLKNWLSNCVSRNQMDYIVFPEYHKLEADHEERGIHFHGLVNAKGFKLADSGKRTEEGQIIYNLGNWKYGWSTVIELDGRTAIVRYVTKYITKSNERIFGKSYFSGGKNLKREVPADYMNLDYQSFEGEEYYIPQARMSVKYKTFNFGENSAEKGAGDAF